MMNISEFKLKNSFQDMTSTDVVFGGGRGKRIFLSYYMMNYDEAQNYSNNKF